MATIGDLTEDQLEELISTILTRIGISSADQIPGSVMDRASVFALEVDEQRRGASVFNANQLAWYTDDLNNARRVWKQRNHKSPVREMPLVKKITNIDPENRTYKIEFGPEGVVEPPPTMPWDEPQPTQPPPTPPGTITVGGPIVPGAPWMGYYAGETNVPMGTQRTIAGREFYFNGGTGLVVPVWLPLPR